MVRTRVHRSKPSSISLERTTGKLATRSHSLIGVLSVDFSGLHINIGVG